MALLPNHLYFTGQATNPAAEICGDSSDRVTIPLSWVGNGRHSEEGLWVADLSGYLPPDRPAAARSAVGGEWQFRIDLGDGGWEQPEFAPFYTTTLRSVWLQDGQIFDYRPAPIVSPSRVIKIDAFTGRLSPRPLYIYLPRGYDEHLDRSYPVLYMQDGQNCFHAFVDDSYAGSWQAELAADLLIRQGLMRECLIVGVGHGTEQRIMEYLPPYARHMPPPRQPREAAASPDDPERPMRPLRPMPGRAERTAAYYMQDVEPYMCGHYRVLLGREQRALCGSSLGGLFTIYMAWEHPQFARHHAAVSTSFWITRNADGSLEAINRLRNLPRREVRLWLDSGTRSAPGRGDDGMRDTKRARAALLEAGYVEGVDFQYYLDEGATHSEPAWAARLPLIFEFLFPATAHC
jgi:predicted alpha/beta superfamily hydrolase